MVNFQRNFEPHVTHKMSEWRVTIRTPCSTSRFYKVRNCQKCELEQGVSAAGEYNEVGLENDCLVE